MAISTWDNTNRGAEISLSGGNLIADYAAAPGGWNCVLSNTSHNSGKPYAEIVNTQISGGGASNLQFGFALNNQNVSSYLTAQGDAGFLRGDMSTFDGNSIGIFAYTSANRGFASLANSDVFCICFDMPNGKAWTGNNGVFGGNPAAGTNPSFTWTPGSQNIFIAWGCNSTNVAPDGIATIHTSGTNQTYSPPSGFVPWDGSLAWVPEYRIQRNWLTRRGLG
jgi:hypothetical protein